MNGTRFFGEALWTRFATMILMLGLIAPESLQATVILEAGEIDSSTVEVGAFATVVHSQGDRHQLSGDYRERLIVARGSIQAIDWERGWLTLAVARERRLERIPFDRILRLILVGSSTLELAVRDDEVTTVKVSAVHLKNGKTYRGVLIEQIAGESLRLQMQDGSEIVFKTDEIAKIVRGIGTGPKEAREEMEIGTLFGLSRISSEGGAATFIGLPSNPDLAGGILGNPSLYLSSFPSEHLEVGAEFNFGWTSTNPFFEESSDNLSFNILYLGGRAGFYPQKKALSGFYFLGHCALTVGNSEGGTNENFSVGAGLGERWSFGSSLILRAEARYRRWIDNGGNDFSLLFGLGTSKAPGGEFKDVAYPEVEIGTLFGLSRRVTDFTYGDARTSTHVGIPKSLPTFFTRSDIPLIYVSWFPHDRWGIGPEFGLGSSFSDGEGIINLYLGSQSSLYWKDKAVSGPYIMGYGALAAVILHDDTDVDSETDFSAGVGLGHQWILGPSLIFRAEGRYRRWSREGASVVSFFVSDNFVEGTNEFSLIFGLGTRIGGS